VRVRSLSLDRSSNVRSSLSQIIRFERRYELRTEVRTPPRRIPSRHNHMASHSLIDMMVAEDRVEEAGGE